MFRKLSNIVKLIMSEGYLLSFSSKTTKMKRRSKKKTEQNAYICLKLRIPRFKLPIFTLTFLSESRYLFLSITPYNIGNIVSMMHIRSMIVDLADSKKVYSQVSVPIPAKQANEILRYDYKEQRMKQFQQSLRLIKFTTFRYALFFSKFPKLPSNRLTEATTSKTNPIISIAPNESTMFSSYSASYLLPVTSILSLSPNHLQGMNSNIAIVFNSLRVTEACAARFASISARSTTI